MKRDISYVRIGWFIFGLVAGVFVAYHSTINIEALRIVATAFAILSGMLIAIMAVIGDPLSLSEGNARLASGLRRESGRKLQRFRALFYVYLVVIALAFYVSLNTNLPYIEYLNRFTLIIATAALIWSFSLPGWIYRVQMDKLDNEVEKRRSNDLAQYDDI